MKQTGNYYYYYYYGARYYGPRLSIFLSVDPLVEKTMTPYQYCNNNPVNLVDPDGREGIVVSGSPGGHINKTHFLVNGLNRAKASKKRYQRKEEKTTWIVYNDTTEGQGFTKEQIDKYRKKASNHGITLKVVTDVDDIVDYVNNKTGGDSREKDPITSFYYVGHATPGDLDVGYGGTGEDFEPDDFDSEAFASGTWINVVAGCRTAIDGFIEDSVVEQFQEIIDSKSTINGSNTRTYYGGV